MGYGYVDAAGAEALPWVETEADVAMAASVGAADWSECMVLGVSCATDPKMGCIKLIAVEVGVTL